MGSRERVRERDCPRGQRGQGGEGQRLPWGYAGAGLSRGGRRDGEGKGPGGHGGDTRPRLPPTYPAGRRPHRAAARVLPPPPPVRSERRCPPFPGGPQDPPPGERGAAGIGGPGNGGGGEGGVPRPSAPFREQRVQPISAPRSDDVMVMSFSRENQAWRGCPSGPPPQHRADTALYQRGLFACK